MGRSSVGQPRCPRQPCPFLAWPALLWLTSSLVQLPPAIHWGPPLCALEEGKAKSSRASFALWQLGEAPVCPTRHSTAALGAHREFEVGAMRQELATLLSAMQLLKEESPGRKIAEIQGQLATVPWARRDHDAWTLARAPSTQGFQGGPWGWLDTRRPPVSCP